MESRKVTCLVIGDPHFKKNELAASRAMGEAILKIAQERKPDFIVCLGDTLDRHENIHTKALREATEWLAKLTEISPIYLLIGNHDRPNNSDFLSDDHPFVGLKYWDRKKIIVVDHVITDSIDDFNFFFVPYVPPGRFQEALKTNPKWDKQTIWAAGFSHQEFYNTQMAPNIFSEKGDKWPLNYPLLINGHIHDRDIPQTNIISVGTPRQHDFDEGFDKTLSLFTFSQSGYHEERIPVPLPKKIIIRVNASEFHTYEPPSPLIDYIKLEIYGTRAEIVAIRKLDKIKKLTKLGINVVTRDIEAGKKSEQIIEIGKWQQIPFRDRLLEKIKGDSEIEKIYTRLFKRKTRIIIKKQ